MTSLERKSPPYLVSAVALATAAAFVADHFAPLGVAVFVLYMVPVALTFFLWNTWAPFATALAGSILIATDYLLTPVGEHLDIAWINRGFGILTLWLVAAIGTRFIRVRRAAIRETWLQTGQARLSELLVGEQKVEEVGDKVLGFYVEYLRAQAAAIFVKDGAVFRLSATYGAAAGSVPAAFPLEDGLLGQAAKDRRPIVLRQVPTGYLAVGSALGQAVPRNLLVAPMKLEGKVHAVIEVGFFDEVTPLHLEMTARIETAVALAVRSVKYRTRLQELLEETRRQTEALQAQSEELRVSNEELEERGRALGESQSRMELQQAELEQINTQLESQAAILESQKRDLLDAKEGLEIQAREVAQASRYKSDFLANMSHELRTPLNSSLILAKLLTENRDGNLTADQVKYAATIESAGNDLLTLINDVLDLSKIEAGHMEITPEPVRLQQVISNLRDIFEPIATGKTVPLRMDLAPGLPAFVVTDAPRLEQILKNLLSNALKFTDRGEVALRIAPEPDKRISFSVSDTGIGIAPENQRIVFEPFLQADGTTSRKYGGTGLGLSISRNLARLLGGEIHLKSEPGRGSVFILTIPEIHAGPSTVDNSAAPEPNAATPAGEPEPAPPVEQPRTANPLKDDRDQLGSGERVILVVEDDLPFARILRALAREMSFRCLVATTAEDALALARQYLPDAVLLDIGLPDNSGLLVLERLKSNPLTRHIPVHIASGSDHTQTAMSLGAAGYMMKPVRREQIVETFRKLETRISQKLRRVLVVEDDPVQVEAMRDLLGSRDVEAVCVRTAAECLEQLQATTFDCMVLDLSLPDASGFTLLETLSQEDSYSFPPVIVYTGRELAAGEEQRLRRYSRSIIIKGARSPERLLDEVTLFLHQVVSDLPAEKQRMLEIAGNRDETLEGKTILIAEDDVRNVFALTSLLEGRGVKVQIARNGREALEALEKSKSEGPDAIDLVLMDIMMPEMDGMEAMREIRKRAEWRKLPIIALTAKAMKDDQMLCLAAGANDYLPKPLDVDKLLSLIRVWMPR